MIFVTGITGHSGTWFLKALIREGGIPGERIRCLVRPHSDTALLDAGRADKRLRIETITGDLEDVDFLRRAMQTEAGERLSVLHIAGIGQSLSLVKAALDNHVKRLILVHTTGIYSKYKKASQDYLEIEKKIDSYIKGKNVDLSILRPTMIYGSMQDHNISFFVKMSDRLTWFPVVNHGENYLQPVHARDLGEAYCQILLNEESTRGKNYDLSGGAPIQMLRMFQIISQKLGSRNHFVSVPYPVAYLGAWAVYVLTLTKADFRERVQRMVEDRCYSHEEAAKDFGYDPMPFEVGITDEIQEFLAKKQSVQAGN